MVDTFEKYYSFLNRKKTLTHPMTRMTLEDFMQNERTQSQSGRCCMIPPLEVSRVAKFTEMEKKEWWASGLGEGMGNCAMGQSFSFAR